MLIHTSLAIALKQFVATERCIRLWHKINHYVPNVYHLS